MTYGGTKLNIILCEGKYDVWFFEEILKEHTNGQTYTIPDKRFIQLQKLYKDNCLDYIKTQFSLVIYGDNGRPIIHDKLLPRVVTEILGKFGDAIYISIILDDDGTDYETLKDIISEKMKLVSKDPLKSTQHRTFEENDGQFILKSSKSKGTLKISLFTVPISLEEQITKKLINVKYPRDSKIIERGPHYAIDFLANKYYNGDKEKLIREASIFLRDETWVQEVVNYIN